MRCLYCGKELALLKRLRGGGDFCSDAHKNSYQEEYNRLALSRLLQAQKKGQQASNAPATEPPAAATRVAVAEAIPEPEALIEEAEAGPEESRVAPQHEPPAEVSANHTGSAVPVLEEGLRGAVITEAPPYQGPEAGKVAGFLWGKPAPAAGPDLTSLQEQWIELSPGPLMCEWQTENGAPNLLNNVPLGNLISLHLQPHSSIGDITYLPIALTPEAFGGMKAGVLLGSIGRVQKRGSKNRLVTSALIDINVLPCPFTATPDEIPAKPAEFDRTVLFADSEFFKLPTTTIDFPAEEAGAIFEVRTGNGNGSQPGDYSLDDHSTGVVLANSVALAPSLVPLDTPSDSPRASLEALSRLHQKLVEQEEARIAEEMSIPAAPPAEVVQPVDVQVVARPLALPEPLANHGPQNLQIVADQPTRPRFATELLELAIKTFPPGKAALLGRDALPTQMVPLYPQMKSLPLRPKIALAHDYLPAGTTSAPDTKGDAKAALPPAAGRTESPSKTGKQATRFAPPKQLSTPAKAEPAAKKSPDAAHKGPVKQAAVEATPAMGATRVTPVAEANSKTTIAEKPTASKPAPAEQTQHKVSEPKPRVIETKIVETKPVDKTSDTVPNFGVAQPAGASWLGSLKLKLGLAIVILVMACVYFLGWAGGKPHGGVNSNAALSSDGAGPSIILGEGGWVEGWGGDPNGMHGGRQITIYRPSLKLSDYRLEFEGSIDTKSLGWVFRAADPANYYAMKLMTVSTGLTPKVALFKYLVVNGKQTQVGRVPIDLAVQPDTPLNIRVDVRGPQFTTYIQGQQVDSWTDDQLKIGGAGFLNERDERGKVKSVSIHYLNAAR